MFIVKILRFMWAAGSCC